MDERSRCADRLRLTLQSEPVQCGGAKLVAQGARSVVHIEQPIVHGCSGDAVERVYRILHALGKENLARGEVFNIEQKALPTLIARKLRYSEFTSRDVEKGAAELAISVVHGQQEIIL